MHIWRAPRRRQRVPRPQCQPTPVLVHLHVHHPTLARSTAAGDPAAPVGPMDRPDAHGRRKRPTRQPVRRCATCAEGAARKVEVSRVAGGAGRRAWKVVEVLIGSGWRGGHADECLSTWAGLRPVRLAPSWVSPVEPGSSAHPAIVSTAPAQLGCICRCICAQAQFAASGPSAAHGMRLSFAPPGKLAVFPCLISRLERLLDNPCPPVRKLKM